MGRKVLIAVGLALSLCAGCWDVEEINRRATAGVIFLDAADAGRVRLGMVFPVPGTQLPPYGATEQEFSQRHFVTDAEGRGFLDAVKELQAATTRSIDLRNIRAIIFTERYLRRGSLGDLYDLVDRSASISQNAVLFICKSDPKALLNMKLKTNILPDIYIQRYFQSPYRRTLAAKASLWKVSSIQINGISDVFLPFIEPAEGQYRITGTGLFSQARYVGELDIDETQILMMLRGEGDGYLTVPPSAAVNALIGFSHVDAAARIEPSTGPDGDLRLKISLNVSGWLQEMKPRELNLSPEAIGKLSARTQSFIRQRVLSLLRKLQGLNSDPAGFGEKVYARDPDFVERYGWHNLYPNAAFEVRAEFRIVNMQRRR